MRELEQLFDVSSSYLSRFQISCYSAIIHGLSELQETVPSVLSSPEEALKESRAWSSEGGDGLPCFTGCIGAVGHTQIPFTQRHQGHLVDLHVWRNTSGIAATNLMVLVRRDLTISEAWIGAVGSMPNEAVFEERKVGDLIPGLSHCPSTCVCLWKTTELYIVDVFVLRSCLILQERLSLKSP